MRWQAKVLAQHALSHTPGASRVEAFARRHITRTTGLSDEQHQQRLRWGGLAYARALLDQHGNDLSAVTHQDVGAGWQPSVPFVLAGLGVRRQHLTDIERHLTVQGCALTAKSIAANAQWISRHIGAQSFVAPVYDQNAPFDRALAQLGISYEVASPALDCRVANDAVDFVSCSGVLPYIPESQIMALLGHCRRVMAPDGLFGVYAHLVDDMAGTDPRISAFNFLRYGEAAWQRWICSDRYTSNRLRFDDYLGLFEQGGFTIVSMDAESATEADLDFLRSADLGSRFAGRDPQLLGIRRFVAVLRKAP